MASPRTERKPKQQPVPSEILDRIPPNDLEAERAVLGSMILGAEVIDEVALTLKADDFYDRRNAIVFADAMEVCGRRQLDYLTLIDRLRKSRHLDDVGEDYIRELVESVPSAAHAVYYAEIVRDKAMLRELVHASTNSLREAYDTSSDPIEVLESAEQRVFAIRERQVGDRVRPVKDVMLAALDTLDAKEQGKAERGLPTGYFDLDKMIGGLRSGEFIVIAGRPSMGKSALALNIIENVSIKAGNPALLVSLEMGAPELGDRLLASNGRVNASKLRTGSLDPLSRKSINESAARISGAQLLIDDTSDRSMLEIAAVARRTKRRNGLALLVIDYLQLIRSESTREPREQQVAAISRQLKTLARKLSIPVICLAQLNRQAEASDGNRPRLSHLRESGAIEQDADVVIFVHRDEYYAKTQEQKERLKGQAVAIVAKQRNGDTGDVPLKWLAEYMRFETASSNFN